MTPNEQADLRFFRTMLCVLLAIFVVVLWKTSGAWALVLALFLAVTAGALIVINETLREIKVKHDEHPHS